ncbi:hypothetical protein [Streptomyces tauricus]|uniref:hypothetical protein n=1 Tax=Streptomyces tauricus TaxID=68274 RepID=UPI0038226BD4
MTRSLAQLIVGHVADRWGVDTLTVGRSVWCELDLVRVEFAPDGGAAGSHDTHAVAADRTSCRGGRTCEEQESLR